VQPCGETCGSAAGFDFWTVEVIQIEKKTLFPQSLNLRQLSGERVLYLEGINYESWALLEDNNFLNKVKKHYYVLLQNKKNI
jgi:hypothetical protein